jgi:CHAT domain-containing protein
VVSLPTGLLQAGAAGVVATGWPVPDGATAALVTEFYRRWRWDDQPPAEALAGAQAWLRDTTNGQKVAHWEGALEAAAPWLPEETAELLLDEYLVREPDALDDAGIGVWAGFAHFGQ